MRTITALLLLCTTLLHLSILPAMAQEPTKNIREMSREEIMGMSYETLMEMPLEDIMILAEIVGVSLEEFYNMILNKDVMTASKRLESSFESPLASTVISYDEIKASGATCIEDALRLVPGLIVRQKTNGNYDIHIRGNDNLPQRNMLVYSENSMTLVMIDGRPVYNYAHGGTFWECLPVGIEDIEKIEVVRGPASSLYGPNAVSGVVNIITRKGTGDKLFVNADLQGGSLSTAIGSLALGKSVSKKFAFRVSGNYESRKRMMDSIYVFFDSTYHTKEEYEALRDGIFSVLDPKDDIDELFPDPWLARNRYTATGVLTFTPNDKISADLAGGYQYSEIISSSLGDSPTPYAGRVSNTSYADLRAKIYGFTLQTNYFFGYQDVVQGDEGFKINIDQINANLEYDYQFKNLGIRPGFYFGSQTYDDTEYIAKIGNGFLNGRTSLSNAALSLRLDYLAFEKLRLVASLRGEKYNHPDDPYLSYQFMGSYNINDKHLLRLVHSRANRGSFLVDTYVNYLWDREGRTPPYYIDFDGNQDLNLLTMDMFEIGYRLKPVRNLFIDIEAFRTMTKDFGVLMADSVVVSQNPLYPSMSNIPVMPYQANLSYQNLDLSSRMNGISLSIDWAPSEKLRLRAFGTWQETKIYDVYPFNNDETVGWMTEFALDQNQDGITDTPLIGPDYTGDGVPDPVVVDTDRSPNTLYSPIWATTTLPDTLVSQKFNKATPTWYGGFFVHYKLMENKLNLFLSSYFYSDQTFINQKQEAKVPSKMIANFKAGYQVQKNVQIYLNVRNTFVGSSAREFAFMDEIKPVILGGVSLSF